MRPGRQGPKHVRVVVIPFYRCDVVKAQAVTRARHVDNEVHGLGNQGPGHVQDRFLHQLFEPG